MGKKHYKYLNNAGLKAWKEMLILLSFVILGCFGLFLRGFVRWIQTGDYIPLAISCFVFGWVVVISVWGIHKMKCKYEDK